VNQTRFSSRRIPVRFRGATPRVGKVQFAAGAVNRVANHQQLPAPAQPAQGYRTSFNPASNVEREKIHNPRLEGRSDRIDPIERGKNAEDRKSLRGATSLRSIYQSHSVARRGTEALGDHVLIGGMLATERLTRRSSSRTIPVANFLRRQWL